MNGTAISKLYVLLGLKSTLGEGTKEAEKQVKALEKELLGSTTKMGAALTAIGGTALLLADKSRTMNADLRATGIQLGLTADEMRALAVETTNITFPLEDVSATFDLLTRAGMRSTEEIVRTSNAFSDLGTALNRPASEMADTLIPAFNAFDIPLENAGDHVDAFMHLLRNTTVDLSDYANMVNYLAPQLDTMNLSIEESVAVMEALADKGIQGGAATREFRKAATQAEGDVKKFYEALGLTTTEVEKYAKEVRGATGMAKEYADAATTQFGTLDHLKQAWSEITFQVGSAIEPFEGVAIAATGLGTVLMGLGPALNLVSAAKTMYASSAIAATAATQGFTAALMANPVTLVAAGVTALAVSLGGYYLATRRADSATKDANQTARSAIEIKRDHVRALRQEIEETKAYIRHLKDLEQTAAKAAGATGAAFSSEVNRQEIAKYQSELEDLNAELEKTAEELADLEGAEIRLKLEQSQYDVDTLEGSLSRILGLMDEIEGTDRTQEELEDRKAIQEIRVRVAQEDLDEAEKALKAWEKGGDNEYALEFGADASRKEHQRLIDEVTKARVGLNGAIRDYNDTLDDLASLEDENEQRQEKIIDLVVDLNIQYGDLALTLEDVAKGQDHINQKVREYIALTPAGQERLRQLDLLYGREPETSAPTNDPSVTFYGKGYAPQQPDAGEFETTKGGGLRRKPGGEKAAPQVTVEPIDKEAYEAIYPPAPRLPTITIDPISSDVLLSEEELNEIRTIRNQLDSDATLTNKDLWEIYEKIQEEIPEMGNVHDLTVDQMIQQLNQYIKRQEVAIANMQALGGTGGTMIVAPRDSGQPERSAATGMPYVPRDMNVRVHRGEAIVPAEQAPIRNVTITINNPAVRDDRDIDLLTNQIFRRLQRA